MNILAERKILHVCSTGEATKVTWGGARSRSDKALPCREVLSPQASGLWLRSRLPAWRQGAALSKPLSPQASGLWVRSSGAEGRSFAREHTILWMAMPSLLDMVETLLTSRAVAL